jgi:hypothetical protein
MSTFIEILNMFSTGVYLHKTQKLILFYNFRISIALRDLQLSVGSNGPGIGPLLTENNEMCQYGN